MDIISRLFQMSTIASVMMVGILLLRRYAKIRIYHITWLWLVVLVRLLLPITIEVPITISNMFDSFDIDTVNSYTEVEDEELENIDTSIQTAEDRQQPIEMTSAERTINRQLLEISSNIHSKAQIILLIWIMGVVSVMMYLLAHLWQFNYKVRACSYHQSDKYLDDICQQIGAKIKLTKKVTIIQSAYTDVPMVYGWLRPCVVLPPKLRQSVSPEKMLYILTHELMHIKRHDALLNYLWLMARALHWYNPLVWVAYSRYQSDVELACDDGVMRYLDKDQCYTYSQSLIDVLKLSKGYALPSIPIALCKDSKNIKRRVTNILNHTRKFRRCMLVIVMTMFVAMTAGFTTACTPNVSSGYIDTPDYQALLTPASKSQVLSCPDTYQDTLVTKDGEVDVVIDAKVYAPDVSKFPVIKAEPTPIEQDTLEMIVDELMEGELGNFPNNIMTKLDIEAKIQMFKAKLENEQLLKDEYERNFGTDVDIDYDAIRNAIRNRIEENTAMLEGAPEQEQKMKASYNYYLDYFYNADDHNFRNMELALTPAQLEERANQLQKNLYLVSDHQISNGDNMRMIVYRENGVEGSAFHNAPYYTVQVMRAKNDFFKQMKPALMSADPTNMGCEGVEHFDAPYPVLSISLQEAVDMAQSLMGDMGIDNFYLADSRIRKAFPSVDGTQRRLDWNSMEDKFYVLNFKPMYKDIPLLLANNRWGVDGQYSIMYGFESIRITVSNEDVVEFNWINPTDTSNIINDNVQLMDFDDIMQSATSYMRQQYVLPNVALVWKESPTYEEDLAQYLGASIQITEIRLGLAGIFDSSDAGGYMIVPTWNFYGSTSWQSDNPDIPSATEVQNYIPILSVNAVDGSIIQQYS